MSNSSGGGGKSEGGGGNSKSARVGWVVRDGLPPRNEFCPTRKVRSVIPSELFRFKPVFLFRCSLLEFGDEGGWCTL